MLVPFLRKYVRPTWQKAQKAYAVRPGVTLGSDVHLGAGTKLESVAGHGLTVGSNVYIGKYCTIEVDGSIGDHVLIANNVGIVGRHDHDYSAVGVGMRSAPHVADPDYSGPGDGDRVEIGADVWIGYGAVILGPVTVGRGAVVAAGAVVVKDVEPYDIVGGSPAKPLGRRFTDDEIAEHEAKLYGTG
ncbi:MAG: DapH/DapD/GlmU-related protein [Actinomycetota bacterium]